MKGVNCCMILLEISIFETCYCCYCYGDDIEVCDWSFKMQFYCDLFI